MFFCQYEFDIFFDFFGNCFFLHFGGLLALKYGYYTMDVGTKNAKHTVQAMFASRHNRKNDRLSIIAKSVIFLVGSIPNPDSLVLHPSGCAPPALMKI